MNKKMFPDLAFCCECKEQKEVGVWVTTEDKFYCLECYDKRNEEEEDAIS